MNRICIVTLAVLVSSLAHAQLNGPVSVKHPIGPALDSMYTHPIESLATKNLEMHWKEQSGIPVTEIKRKQQSIVRVENGLLLSSDKLQQDTKQD